MPRKKGSKNGEHTTVALICERCSKKFEVEPSQSSRKYCSWDCRKGPFAGLTPSQKAKERREKFKANGLCYNCGKCPPTDGMLKCNACIVSSRKSNQSYDKKHGIDKYKIHKQKMKDVVYREKYNQYRAEFRWKKRLEVIEFLGGKCECCGETTKEWLDLDHVNQDGKKHRQEVGRGLKLLRDMLNRPDVYKVRVLCANCHAAITRYGSCPHKSKVEKHVCQIS